MRRSAFVALVILALVAAGCGDDDAAVRSDGDGPAGDASGGELRYRGSGTILESPDHGPELCDGVEDSYPPQCGGVPLVGWDWDAVDGEESADGTTWGAWEVTGTWDGEALTLTEAPTSPPDRSDDDNFSLATPCPAPEGGWAPVDPAKVSTEAQDAAMRVADQLPDVAGTWVDQSINPALADGFDPGDEALANDPALLVVNVQVTADVAGAEAAIREVWGGALCVLVAERTMAELRSIQDELVEDFGTGPPGGISSAGIDVARNQVQVTVFVATPELARELDHRFGDAVAVTGLLEPVP